VRGFDVVTVNRRHYSCGCHSVKCESLESMLKEYLRFSVGDKVVRSRK
jgi:hypothetical protein